MTNEINIAMITDQKYLLPTAVALRTLVEKANRDVMYHIYLIMDEECQKNWDRYYQIEKDNNIDIVAITPEMKEDVSEFQHSYVSKAALAKFCLAEIFPQLDKILYVDGDVIFHSDLTDLYDTDIADCYAAVVKDMPSYIWGDIGELGLTDYFNSGMMLLNLKKMREDDVKNKLFEYKKHEIRKLFMDQDAFNMVFANQVKFISPIYNFVSACYECATKEEICAFYGIDNADLEKIEIDHMAGVKKPWKDATSDKMLDWFPYLSSDREMAMCLQSYQKTIITRQDELIKELRQEIELCNEKLKAHEDSLNEHKEKIMTNEMRISKLDNIVFIRLWRKIRKDTTPKKLNT